MVSNFIQFDSFRLNKMPQETPVAHDLLRSGTKVDNDLVSSIILSLKQFFISVCGNHNTFLYRLKILKGKYLKQFIVLTSIYTRSD